MDDIKKEVHVVQKIYVEEYGEEERGPSPLPPPLMLPQNDNDQNVGDVAMNLEVNVVSTVSLNFT